MKDIKNDLTENALEAVEAKELPLLFVYPHTEDAIAPVQEPVEASDVKQPLLRRIFLKLRQLIDKQLADDSGKLNLDIADAMLPVEPSTAALCSETEHMLCDAIDRYLHATEAIAKDKLEAALGKIAGNAVDFSLQWVKLPATAVEPEPSAAVDEAEAAVQAEPLDLAGVMRKIIADDPTAVKHQNSFYIKVETLCKANGIKFMEYQYLKDIFDGKKSVGSYIYQGINKELSPNAVMDKLRIELECKSLTKTMLLEFQALICQVLDWDVDLEAVYYMGTNGGDVEAAGKQAEIKYPALPSFEPANETKGIDDDYLSELYKISKSIKDCEERRKSGTMGITELREKVSVILAAAQTIIDGKENLAVAQQEVPKYRKSLAEQVASSIPEREKNEFLPTLRKYYIANPYWLSKENWRQFDSVLTGYQFSDLFYQKAYPAFSMSLKAGWGDKFLQEDRKKSDANARNALCDAFCKALEESRSGKNCAKLVVGIFIYVLGWTDVKDEYKLR